MVQFNGSDTAITELEELFNGMAAMQLMGEHEQLPDFIKVQEGHFYNIRWEDGVLYYETKWSPNISVLKIVVDRYGVGFIQDYAEIGMRIYGRAVYQHRILTDTFLEEADYESYIHQDENDTWLFEGREYNSDVEILEILLQRRLTKRNENN